LGTLDLVGFYLSLDLVHLYLIFGSVGYASHCLKDCFVH